MLGILAKLIYRSGFKFLRGNCGKTRLKSHHDLAKKQAVDLVV
jgi:hypothetical protein